MNLKNILLSLLMIVSGCSLNYAMEECKTSEEPRANETVSDIYNKFNQLLNEPVTDENQTAFKLLFNSMLNLDIETIRSLYEKLDAKSVRVNSYANFNVYFEAIEALYHKTDGKPCFVQAVQTANAQAVKFLLALANIAAPNDTAFLESNQLYHGATIRLMPANETVKAIVKSKNKKMIKLIFEFLTCRRGTVINNVYSAFMRELLSTLGNDDLELITYIIPIASRKYTSYLYQMAERNQNIGMRKMISQELTKRKGAQDIHPPKQSSLKKLCTLTILNNGIEIESANIPLDLKEYVIKIERKEINSLVKACLRDDHPRCQCLIDQGVDIHSRSKFGVSYAEIVARVMLK